MPDLGLAGYSATALIALVVSAFIAGLARGFSGFGAALIFMPLASAIVGPKLASPILLVVDIVAAAPLIPHAWRIGNRREVGTMAVGLVIGIPTGAWILTRADPVLVRWMLVALIVPLLALLLSGWRYRGQPAPLLTVAVGGASGVLSGIAQVGGPPIILYWLGSNNQAGLVRANIVVFFAISTALAVVSYTVAGLLSASVFGLAVVTGPAYGLGLWIGSRMFGLASETTFRRICYALIAVAAVISLPVFDDILR